MKRIQILSAILACLFFGTLHAQNTNQCVHCKMDIQDELHKATVKQEGLSLQFDAIECLINYMNINQEHSFETLQVSDYKTGSFIDAKTATYLKSKAIPSPMGADLSAFNSQENANKFKEEKSDEILTWIQLNEKFKDSKFGAINHNHHDHYRPDAHAPIGIMGDHLHEIGGLMVSFRYMSMNMDGNKSGTDVINDSDIYNNFLVAPQNMTMDMYMIGLMYAPSDKLTLMAMQNISKKNMNLTAQMMMGDMIMLRDFSTKSSGFGDLKLGALYGIYTNDKTSLHLNGNLNIPIGDIENRDDTPMMDDVKLPYTMQLGSGTFDVTLGATLKGNCINTSYGTQFLSTFRTGENSEGYRFGNLYQLNIWGAYKLSSNFSLSGRIFGVSEGKLKGMDNDLDPMVVTTANTNNYGRDKIKTYIGVNIAFPEPSSLKDFRFGCEAGAPIYENYNGIQMNENLSLNFGVKYNLF